MRKAIIWSFTALVLFMGGVAIGSGLHRDRCWLTRIPFGFGPSADWACVSREVADALTITESAAIAVGRQKLDAWHDKIKTRVDQDFLDEHLSLLNQWWSTGRYIWTRIRGGEEAALLQQLEDQNKRFQERVLSDDEFKADMGAVAKEMTESFMAALDARLGKIGERYHLSVAELDARLLDAPNPDLIDVVEDPTGRIHLRFRIVKKGLQTAQPFITSALTGLNNLSGARLISGIPAGVSKEAPKEGAKKLADHAGHHTAHHVVKHVAHHAARVVVTKAGATLLGGPFALVALSGALAWEWWDFKEAVAKQKPQLLQQIEDAFRVYEVAMLRPNGHLGSVIRRLRDEIGREADASMSVLAGHLINVGIDARTPQAGNWLPQ